MKRYIILFTILLFCFLQTSSASAQQPKRFDKLSAWTIGGSIAASSLDYLSSKAAYKRGGCEANPLLRSKDGCAPSGPKFAFYNGAAIGGSVVVQALFPKSKKYAEGFRLIFIGGHGLAIGFNLSF